MKTSCSLFFLLFIFNAAAQIRLDRAVRKKYDAAYAKTLRSSRNNIEQLEKSGHPLGFAIFKIYREDTLNKQELVKQHAKISFMDAKGKIIPDNDEEADFKNMPLPSSGRFYNDTLNLSIGIMFSSIKQLIVEGKQRTFYEEFYKYDTILRLNLRDMRSNRLSVPVKLTKFTLNTLDFKKEDLLYGEVEFETFPYYMDDALFKNNYIRKKLSGSYVFKIRLQKTE